MVLIRSISAEAVVRGRGYGFFEIIGDGVLKVGFFFKKRAFLNTV